MTEHVVQAERSGTAAVRVRNITGWRRIIHPELSRGGTCGLCVAATSRIYRTGKLKPVHAGCVDGSTLVASDAVLGLTRRNYSGPLVVFSTASGEDLTVTPNHPILTSDGWIPAALLKEGDEVIRSLRGERVVLGGPDEEQAPTTVEDAWRALTVDHGLDATRMPLAPEDFYGDGADGEVDVVTLERLLPDVGQLSFAQPTGELGLIRGWLRRMGLSGEGALPEAAFDGGDAAGGVVRGLGDGSALVSGGLGVASGGGLGEVAPLDASLAQDATDDVAIDAMAVCEHHFAVAVDVLLSDELDREIGPLQATRFDPSGVEFAGEGRRAYAELGSDLRDRLAGEVFGDRVVDCRVIECSDHLVYDLWTSEGWFEANSYIISNCNCGVLPIVGEDDPGDALNRLDLGDLYDDAGQTTDGWTLKQTRYQVGADGQLVAVKTREKQGAREPLSKIQARARRKAKAARASKTP